MDRRWVWLLLVPLSAVVRAQERPRLENLGTNVNSVYDDYKPIVSADGRTLYFVRQGDPRSTSKGEEIWVSVRGADGRWGKAVPLGPGVNNERNNGVMAVAADNNQIVVCQAALDPANILSVAVRDGNDWKVVRDIVIENYYNRSKYFDFCLSQDGQYLVAAIAREDTLGGQDLYVCFRTAEGRYTEPRHMGRVINTWDAETSPFLAADNRTLYFSSRGHGGKGDADIFVSRRLDDTWTNWSKPENLDWLNTEGRDHFFTLSASGEEGFLVSDRNTIGEEDIFSVKVPPKYRPLPVGLVAGRVLDSRTRNPVKAEIRYFDLATDEPMGSAISDPATGSYSIVLQGGRRYGFRAEAEGFFPISENLDLSRLDRYREVQRDLLLAPVRRGEPIRLNNLFFDTGRWELKPESRAEIRRLARFLKENPGIAIVIEGHTDNVGDDAMNRTLSERRAQAVLDALVAEGIPASRLKSRGHGSTKPVAPNDTEEGRARNRRVEFTVGP